MYFWKAQQRARSRTAFLLLLFVSLTLGMALAIEYGMWRLAQEGETPPLPYVGLFFLVTTFLVATIYYLIFCRQGGRFVARSLGGREIEKTTSDYKEQQLLHVVEEMAIASGLPVPPVFLLPTEAVNAFAAGIGKGNAVIAVTRGALTTFTREELQGVVAHEFGHIYNADMKMGMRIAAMVMGFVFILYLGIRLLEGSLLMGGGRRRNGGNNNPLALVALALIVAGAITWVAGALLRATVSREREYLADACAVQFTRNPDGIASALTKLATLDAKGSMPPSGMAYAHLYFNHPTSFWSALFATHPPLQKRIDAIRAH